MRTRPPSAFFTCESATNNLPTQCALEFHDARSPQSGLARTIQRAKCHSPRTFVRRGSATRTDLDTKVNSSALFLRRTGKCAVCRNLRTAGIHPHPLGGHHSARLGRGDGAKL